MRLKPLVLKDGKKQMLPVGDVLDGQDNFSYKKVKSGESITIVEDQQMLMTGMFTNLGQFNNFGEFYQIDLEDSDTQQVIPPADPENFSHFKVSTGETKTIPSNQQMTVFEQFTNFGQLNNLGDFRLFQVFQEDAEDVITLPDDNFSYKEIVASQSKTIPIRQQMVVVGMFKNFGQLNVLGEMALISGESETDLEDDYLPPYKIESGETFKIGTNRLMFLPRSLINLGQLNNFGELALGGL
jgi:hypothetical protein